MENQHWACGAELVVRHLEAQGVKQVFGIPGAKIDRGIRCAGRLPPSKP